MRLKADFNEVEDDHIWVSLRGVTTLGANLSPGASVELYDNDGDSCLARITESREASITCRIDWKSWRSLASHLDSRNAMARPTNVEISGAKRSA